MARYIDADRLNSVLDKNFGHTGGAEVAKQLLDDAPTADVKEVVRGVWTRQDDTQALLSVQWKCSQCGQIIQVDGILTAIGAGWKFCPNCGADMRGKAK